MEELLTPFFPRLAPAVSISFNMFCNRQLLLCEEGSCNTDDLRGKDYHVKRLRT
jgi:hypothetical protein